MALEPSKLGWIAAILGVVAVAATGCETQAFCFDCGETSSGTGTTTGEGGSGGETCIFCAGGSGGGGNGNGGSGDCVPSNQGIEVCDGVDNDCKGGVDDLTAEEFAQPRHCGTCLNDCYDKAINCKVDDVGCTPSEDPGMVPGTCTCAECATDYYDLDGDAACEYFCKKNADDDAVCNNKDDDCDGQKDEDVDLCDDPLNCGKCGRTCAVLHGQGDCVQTGAGACTEANTACQILDCDCPTPDNCWHDLDGVFATGCEYQCEVTNGGVEICDGLDNDCDGFIDGADDLSGDMAVGAVCHGDPEGLCATAEHAGVTQCQGGLVVCVGADVLKENQKLETCNGVDDDCDGVVDDNPTGIGASCGVSAIFPCSLGSQQCVNGAIECVGAVLPAAMETCNGVDDDCDGEIDATAGMPPPDSVGACNVPVAAPAGATQPCQAGVKACQGGQVVCVGSAGPTGPVDSCGDDSNCDGVLTNQPNFMTDVAHCGDCTTNCQMGALHTIVVCNMGVCENQGCEPGYYDLDGDGSCEYACNFISAQEACNGVDDDCDGQIDEGVITPLPTQVCGVSPSAMSDECKPGAGGVQVSCSNGAWVCTFPAGVCPGGCSQDDEICDTLDNDCDGVLNENVGNFGQPCASDDGLQPPGHGACRTTGTFQCSSPTATACNAVKADCSVLPGGCTELCDGIDNDCDGVADETINAPGANAANYVKPAVTRIGTSLWTYTYEASRPSATDQSPGTGNGFWTSAPAGQTLDKTPACSAPGKIPWFNVTPREVMQTCQQMGGQICTRSQFQTACTPGTPMTSCIYGYNPRGGAGSACATGFTGTKRCNLAQSFDFDPALAGDQDGLLPTASPSLANCWADWSSLQGNTGDAAKLFDLTGNLREIAFDTNPAPCGGTNQPPCNVYRLMGGAFNSESEPGSACNFTFYTVNETFKFFDTGFRCCFGTNPSP